MLLGAPRAWERESERHGRREMLSRAERRVLMACEETVRRSVRRKKCTKKNMIERVLNVVSREVSLKTRQ